MEEGEGQVRAPLSFWMQALSPLPVILPKERGYPA